MIRNFVVSVFCMLLLSPSSDTFAENTKKIKVVIHVTKANNRSYRAALNYAMHLQKEYSTYDKEIEVVSNGCGIGLVNSHNVFGDRIQELQKLGIKFTACSNSLKAARKISGVQPLVKGVVVVKSGVLRVIKLQREGFMYITP